MRACAPRRISWPAWALAACLAGAATVRVSAASPGGPESAGDAGQTAPAPAETAPVVQAEAGEGQLSVLARIYNKTKEGKVFAFGEVELRYKDARLFADRVEVDPETKDFAAEGNIAIHLPSEVISAERVTGNLETKTFKIKKALGMIQPTVFYAAAEVEKKENNLYRLTAARLTSCSQPVPRWQFSFRRADLVKHEYVAMWNAVFRIKKVPVFWWPYLRYPLDRDRSTGFLMPQIGYAGNKGFTLNQSFYWVLARNMDATFALDVYGARGVGTGVEYRYLFGGGTSGQVDLYYFRFKRDELGEKTDDAAVVRLKHNQTLPGGFSLAANVDYTSSFDFLREFDNNFRRAVISNRRSEIYLARSWANSSFSIRMSRFETYFQQMDQAVIQQYLPQVSLNVFKTRLWRNAPVYFSLAGALTSWQYGWTKAYEEGTQQKSTNMSLAPRLSVPFSGIPWLNIQAEATTTFTYYAQSYQPNTRIALAEPLFVPRFAGRIELRGPTFVRLWHDAETSAPKIKHIFEPYARYNYETPVDRSARIPTAYGFYRYHQLEYGLSNSIMARVGGMPRSIVEVNVGQTYYLSEKDNPLSNYPIDGRIPRFSELSAYVRVYPGAGYNLDFSIGYNPYQKAVSSMRLGASAGNAATGKFLTLSWFRSKNAWLQNIDPNLRSLYDRHQVAAYGGVKLPGLGLDLTADVDFNVQEAKLLYAGASAVYHYQCLDFLVEVKVFYYRDKPEAQFKFSLGLGNIGKTTDFLGGFGF